MPVAPIALLLLALVGIADTLWLTQAHLLGGSCGDESGCSAMLASDYTRIFGLPLATLGLGFYLLVAGLAWRALVAEMRQESIRWISVLTGVGVFPVVVLVYLQGFVIGAWCPYCLLSAGLMILLLVVSVLHRRQSQTLQTLIGRLPELRVAIAAAVALATPSLLFLGLEQVLSAQPIALHSGGTSQHIAARVGTRQITIEELDKAIQLRVTEARSSMCEEWLDLQVLETEAAKSDVTVDQLMQQVKPPEITQQHIDDFFEANGARMPPNVPRSRLDPQIREQLLRDGHRDAEVIYIQRLRQRYGTQLSPPATERFAIDANPLGAPERGPADAAVTIVAFSDLACSYCAKAHLRLDELQQELGADLRVVFRHFPLKMHPEARLAAEVSACADEQNLFWPMVDVLFENQRQLGTEQLQAYGESVGLNLTQLDECLQSHRGDAVVNADLAEGDELGVSSTPSFFINGHFMKDLPSVENLQHLVQVYQ